jgi:hypothetical protein
MRIIIILDLRYNEKVASDGEKMWNLNLFQKVMDPASIEIFWSEITQGAYGAVDQIEGVFNFADGRGVAFSFVADESHYQEIEDVPCLSGRPDRPSFLKVMGQSLDTDLDTTGIEETLAGCSLPDHVLAYYQSQLHAEAE